MPSVNKHHSLSYTRWTFNHFKHVCFSVCLYSFICLRLLSFQLSMLEENKRTLTNEWNSNEMRWCTSHDCSLTHRVGARMWPLSNPFGCDCGGSFSSERHAQGQGKSHKDMGKLIVTSFDCTSIVPLRQLISSSCIISIIQADPEWQIPTASWWRLKDSLLHV